MKINFNGSRMQEVYYDEDLVALSDVTIHLTMDEYLWMLEQAVENKSLEWKTEIFISPNKKI